MYAVSGLTPRLYAGESDLQPIVDLTDACERVDQIDSHFHVDQLRVELKEPGLVPERDIRLWEDESSTLAAYSQVRIEPEGEKVDARFWFYVLPEMRGRGLEAEIIRWAAATVRAEGETLGKPAVMHMGVRDFDANRRRLLESGGFSPARYFFRMARDLSQPIDEPRFPDGYTARHSRGPEDHAAWVEMFNLSFIDHWNFHPLTLELIDHYNANEPDYDPALDLIGVAPDGTFAAFCFCQTPRAENEATGRNDGWVHLLGTRRGHRNIGLGRAMLLLGLRTLKDAGASVAKLGVDADNPTGALGLYERVDFYRDMTTIIYEADV